MVSIQKGRKKEIAHGMVEAGKIKVDSTLPGGFGRWGESSPFNFVGVWSRGIKLLNSYYEVCVIRKKEFVEDNFL